MWLFRSGLVLFAYTAINIYTGVRVLGLVKFFLPAVKVYLFWPLYIICCYSYIIVFFLRLDRLQPLRQIAMYSLPAVVYFFLAILLFDLFRLFWRFFGRFPLSPLFVAAGTGIALGLALLVLVSGAINARYIRTTNYTVTLNKGRGESPLRVVQLSDLHIGTTVNRKWLARMVDAANKAKPDMIVLTGDIFDNNLETIRDLDGIASELRRFNAPLGVYACQGNHDVDRISLRNNASTDRIQEFLNKAEISLLLDEVILIADRFYLAGRRDARPIGMSSARKTPRELAAGLDVSKPLFFLDHQPTDFPRIEEAGADFIFSGHTHKGQFFPGNIVTYHMYKDAGASHYGIWQGRSAQGVISSGSGVWGPPIRVFTKSEAVVVDIKFGN